MCGDIGTTSRVCAAYSFTGILFTVSAASAEERAGAVALGGVEGRCIVRHWSGDVGRDPALPTDGIGLDQYMRGRCTVLVKGMA